jgi:hypothetical protein
MAKQNHQVMTSALEGEYQPEQVIALKACFDMLKEQFPKEYHFIIRFASANKGEGKDVWYIIDEGDKERIETMLRPADY